VYREDAEKYAFSESGDDGRQLPMAAQPILRWFNDDDWSGDVFLWTADGLPAVVGCLLSGPQENGARIFFHEFHLLSEQPIAPADLQTQRRWQPKQGLPRERIAGAPQPAATPAVRLSQMRALSREFTAHMEADGPWELRLLSQPLYRYGEEEGQVVDGALFAYVWTKGTDPELMLLVECRDEGNGRAWHYAPVRFSNRQLWLRRDGAEIWRAESHREPTGQATDLIYTTAYARTASLENAGAPNP
jgi:hypothetical protein